MANTPTPKNRHARKTVSGKTPAAEKPLPKKVDITPPKRPKGVVSNKEKNKRSEHIANLINDTLWLLGLVATIYLMISLASFSMNDPAWSRSVPQQNTLYNMGGLFGAYLADIRYYLFGLSFWWVVIASLVFLFKHFRPLQTPEHKPYNLGIAAAGLTVLLICSPMLEVLAFKQELADS